MNNNKNSSNGFAIPPKYICAKCDPSKKELKYVFYLSTTTDLKPDIRYCSVCGQRITTEEKVLDKNDWKS